MRKYKTPIFQRCYDTMLKLADCSTSELYHKGAQRRGAAHRCAFWDGFNGKTTQMVPAKTLTAVCYQAGKDFAKREKQSCGC